MTEEKKPDGPPVLDGISPADVLAGFNSPALKYAVSLALIGSLDQSKVLISAVSAQTARTKVDADADRNDPEKEAKILDLIRNG